ncbi:MAG: hypothetical protein F6K26_48700 [Moorea sp. SIO2I5]|nr:hypothetical protein [Moorena sp. SIO2I5]
MFLSLSIWLNELSGYILKYYTLSATIPTPYFLLPTPYPLFPIPYSLFPKIHN